MNKLQESKLRKKIRHIIQEESAPELYSKIQTEINELMKQLQSNLKSTLKSHAKQFKTNDTNYGYVGDLNSIKSGLEEMIESVNHLNSK